MTACGLPIKMESTGSEFSGDLAITKPCEAAHLCGDHDCVVVAIRSRRKRDFILTFAARFNELPGNVPSDVKGFRNCPSLRNETRQLIGSRHIDPPRQLLDLDANGEFHLQDNCTSGGQKAVENRSILPT